MTAASDPFSSFTPRPWQTIASYARPTYGTLLRLVVVAGLTLATVTAAAVFYFHWKTGVWVIGVALVVGILFALVPAILLLASVVERVKVSRVLRWGTVVPVTVVWLPPDATTGQYYSKLHEGDDEWYASLRGAWVDSYHQEAPRLLDGVVVLLITPPYAVVVFDGAAHPVNFVRRPRDSGRP